MFEIWSTEFEGAYLQGGLFNLCMHPQIIGRYHRLQLLDKMIRFIKGFPGVWFATCAEAAHVIRDQWDLAEKI